MFHLMLIVLLRVVHGIILRVVAAVGPLHCIVAIVAWQWCLLAAMGAHSSTDDTFSRPGKYVINHRALGHCMGTLETAHHEDLTFSQHVCLGKWGSSIDTTPAPALHYPLASNHLALYAAGRTNQYCLLHVVQKPRDASIFIHLTFLQWYGDSLCRFVM